ncbi:MAG: response regulator transcription factor, partial [Hyphomicrobiaceae bacterium]|nr:response regulator transcription factor [Hyphomicrobiaceae bacterium]
MTEPQPEYEAAVKRQKIAIADKNPVVRSGLQDFIGRDGRFQVVGTSPTGGEFLELTEKVSIDIAVVGWALLDMNGADVLSALKR